MLAAMLVLAALSDSYGGFFCCVVLLAWGGCENARFLVVSELAVRAFGVQNLQGQEEPQVICLHELIPNGSSLPSHALCAMSAPTPPSRAAGPFLAW